MLRENIQEILNVTNIATSGEGPVVSTGEKGDVQKTGNAGVFAGTAKCRFCLNVTGFTGTSMLVEIKAEVGGIDILMGTFTSVTGVVEETIEIDNCALNVKAVYTENTVTDFDATIHSVRF